MEEEVPEEDLEFLITHTTCDKATVREWYKAFKKDCPTGQITREKFFELYKMFSFPSGNSEQLCDHVFRTIDTDRSGFIEFREFLLAFNVVNFGTAEEKLEWVFNLYDIDGNGTIGQDEMANVVQAIYNMLGAGASRTTDSAEDRAESIFSQMDSNEDGYLTLEEFISGCLQDDDVLMTVAPNLSRTILV